MSNKNHSNRGLIGVSLVFSMVAIGMSIFLVFGNGKTELQAQAIYWFGFGCIIAGFPFLAPWIKRFEVKGVGFEMKDTNISIATSVIQDIDLYLEQKGKVPPEKDKEIEDKLGMLNPSHLELVYHYLEGWRTQQVFRIISFKGDKKMQDKIREDMRLLESMFKALIYIVGGEKDNKYIHNYYSRLAFVYKDMLPKNLPAAYECIENAISRRPNDDNMTFTLYEFNRLMIAIELEKEKYLSADKLTTMNADFLVALQDPATRWMLNGTDSEIAPGLNEWLVKNKYTETIKKVSEAEDRYKNEVKGIIRPHIQ